MQSCYGCGLITSSRSCEDSARIAAGEPSNFRLVLFLEELVEEVVILRRVAVVNLVFPILQV